MASVEERYVRFRYFHWFVPATDPVTLQEIQVERAATHGMKVSTAESGDEPHTQYGLTAERLRWGDLNGAFFSKAEVKAMEAGITDVQTPMEGLAEPRGDTATSAAGTHGMATATVIDPPAVHPLAFEEMNIVQMAEYMKEADLSPNEILEIAHATPNSAEFIYSAAVMANGGVAPEGLSEGVASILGYGVADPGTSRMGDGEPAETPEGAGPTHEGVETPDETNQAEVPPHDAEATETPPATEDDTGDGGQEPPPAGPEPSEAAVALAKEHDLDLALVTGTGADNRVVQADVQKYLSEQESKS